MKKFFKETRRKLKGLNKTISYVHKKTTYLYTFIFLDILWCYIVYGTTYNEYRIFEFYKIDASIRKTYMSRRKFKKVNRKLVDHEILNVINDKELFLRRFRHFLKRTIFNVNDVSFKQFEDLALDTRVLISRSPSKSYISSYKEYDIKNYRSPAFVLKEIVDSNNILVENKLNQHRKLNEIDDLVLINIVSVCRNANVDLVSSTIKFKKGDKIITGSVNVIDRCIKGHFKDENGNDFGESFEGFEIPCYTDVKDSCVMFARELDEIKQIEWTFMVDNNNVVHLVDANEWTDYIFSQMPEFLNNRIGLMSYYKKIL